MTTLQVGSDHNDDFSALMREWIAGSPTAFNTLFDRYSLAIRLVVRRRMDGRLRSEFDSLDFVQDVWASIIALDPKRCRFDNQNDLLRYLLAVARNKLFDRSREKFATLSRDKTREESLDADKDLSEQLIDASQPTPSKWFMELEKREELLRSFPSGYRLVVEQLLQGYSQKEIASRTGLGIRSIERIVKRVKGLCGA